jgi:Fic family protein
LVQLAIVHSQFEIIHPFWDGNGRVWRIILPLFLRYKKILTQPMFYISEYLENNRDTYYKSLNWISKNNDWESWIIYFLTAVKEQSEKNIQKVQKILELYETKKTKVRDITHSQFSINALDFIFSYPVFTSTTFIKLSKIPKWTAMTILHKLEQGGVVKMMSKWSGKRPSLYIFPKLVHITG